MRDLRADLALCAKATPGPWKVNLEYQRKVLSGKRYFPAITGPNEQLVLPLMAPRYKGVFVRAQDAEFIVTAREGWPEAIARALNAEAERNALIKVATAALHLLESVPEEVWANNVWAGGMNEGVEQARSIIRELRQLLNGVDQARLSE